MASPMLKPEPTKTRPKKTASKNPNHKKPPQRGLGVAQLERLRLQERWDKLTEMPPALIPPHHFHFPALHHFPAAPPPTAAILGFDHHGMLGNGGFTGGGATGFMAVDMYPHGVGTVDPRVLIGNSVEASRELSSIPKFPPSPSLQCGSDRRDLSFKKKRVNFNDAGETPQSLDFLGLNTNSGGITPNQYSTDLGFKLNFNQGGAEVKQIHRRGAEEGGGGEKSVLMEYEFFPSKNCRGTEFEELKMPKEAELVVSFAEDHQIVLMDHGEGSCITTSCTDIINGGISTSTALDLSLKLSF